MSNQANDLFMDVMEVLNQLIYKSPAYNIDINTSRNLAHIFIDCNADLANTPFLDVETEGYWHLKVRSGYLFSKASTLNWSYSNKDGEYRLYGVAGNGRQMKSPAVYDDGKPLELYYPKLKDILKGKTPSGFAFFTVALASTLSYEVTGIGISAEEFVAKWQEAVATGDIHALDSLTYHL